MYIKTLTVGPIETNCYVVSDEQSKSCAVIDPGDESGLIMNYIEENGLSCDCVLLTHAHFDHVGAVEEILEETGAALYMNRKDDGVSIGSGESVFNAPEGTKFYQDGDHIHAGTLDFTVLETPGHTPGGVCLLCGDAIFSGDTLFRDSCGRTDFNAGSAEDMMRSLKRIAQLPGDYEIYPGHGFATSLERERRFNYFMRAAMEG